MIEPDNCLGAGAQSGTNNIFKKQDQQNIDGSIYFQLIAKVQLLPLVITRLPFTTNMNFTRE